MEVLKLCKKSDSTNPLSNPVCDDTLIQCVMTRYLCCQASPFFDSLSPYSLTLPCQASPSSIDRTPICLICSEDATYAAVGECNHRYILFDKYMILRDKKMIVRDKYMILRDKKMIVRDKKMILSRLVHLHFG